MIAIIDYGLGNLTSVKNAIEKVGARVVITCDKEQIREARGVVLPGVGAAKVGMANLRHLGLDNTIVEISRKNKPIIGICLGMQLLFTMSEEGNVKCLNVCEGEVKKFDTTVKVPHIGWNQVKKKPSRLFADIPDQSSFYFVHSYYCAPSSSEIGIGSTDYGADFCSVMEIGNTFGVQFHPEKSGENGLKLLRNFTEVAYANNTGN